MFGDIEYDINKRFHVHGWIIRVQKRSKRNRMGRFGGGWQWKVGAQWTTYRYVLVNLLVMTIIIEKEGRRAPR